MTNIHFECVACRTIVDQIIADRGSVYTPKPLPPGWQSVSSVAQNWRTGIVYHVDLPACSDKCRAALLAQHEPPPEVSAVLQLATPP